MTLTPGYCITAELRVKDSAKVDIAREAMRTLCAQTLKEPGCRFFTLHQDAQVPTRFLLWEVFDDEAAFKAHFETAHTKAYLAQDLTEVVQHFKTNLVA